MRTRVLLIATALAGGFIMFTSQGRHQAARLLKTQPVGQLWSPPAARGAGLSSDEVNNIDIYKTSHHSVVNISSTVYRTNWFLEMYPSREIGSGFFIDAEGRILTNNHVIAGSRELQVTLADQSRYRAEVLARDQANDLALIKITPKKKAVFLRLGDSDGIQVGQKVLAIGNPFGLEGTLTTGIISSLGRAIQDENGRRMEGLVQTDAAINPGNSGGPLLDSQGSVIGINTAIYGQGGNIGIGFAMPINRAKAMLGDYQAGKKQPRLGVSVTYVAGDLADALDLPTQGGLLVQDVQASSAAEAAGIRGPRRVIVVGNQELGIGGDFILAIDGRAVDRSDAIARALLHKHAGDTVDLLLFRNGRQVTVKVRLGEAHEDRI
jgi:S1-C subfamily serine protease